MYNLDRYEGNPSEHIAIVGMTGRFPGADNIKEFWKNLYEGVESIKFFTKEELDKSNIDPELKKNPKYVSADGIIEDIGMFDAEFFGISPREAELMDPQHRMFLECAWELMEQAGYDSNTYQGRVGVYGSANLSSYLIRNIMSNPELSKTATSFQTLITNDKDFVATRVSYKMNLKGPSMSVATLCSSSFVAIHLACQSLLNYQCDMALAGAVSLQVSRNESYFYQEGGIGDPDGHCRAFDAKAGGTVSGNGIGLVALKRLEDAVQDGDTIHAVIRGAAVNNDGSIKYSYTAPSVEGQAAVIAEAVSLAEVDPETITYIETHGTGTKLGDPIEIAALTKAFNSRGAKKKQYCAIGSVKTNIGHLVNAGGVASLIKTVLSMQNKKIPASLNFNEPNPDIDFENSPFYVNKTISDWKTDGFPRRAGISSFGIGGTNVHMVVEEAPEQIPTGASRSKQILVLSARSHSALQKQVANLLRHMEENLDINFADAAYTLQVGRRNFEYRLALLCSDSKDAISALGNLDTNRVKVQFQESKCRPVIFLFPDTEEVYFGMGKDLYLNEPDYKDAFTKCSELIKKNTGTDLQQVLYTGISDSGLLKEPGMERAVLFAVEYSLASLWMKWGVKPEFIVGKGTGEYVAACLSGVMSLEDALKIITNCKTESSQIKLNKPSIPFISNVTGTWIREDKAVRPEYWITELPNTKSHDVGLSQIVDKTEHVLVEVGPGRYFAEMIRTQPVEGSQQVLLSDGVLQKQSNSTEIDNMLNALCKLWLSGVQIDWYGFSSHEKRRRIPLPTYPFEKKLYWIEPQISSGSDQIDRKSDAGSKEISREKDISDWFYIQGWKTGALPPKNELKREISRFLIFSDDKGIGAFLAEQLEQSGHSVIIARMGNGFSKESDGHFTVGLRNRDDYNKLFKTLSESDKRPLHVIHLWSLTDSRHSDGESFREAQDTGFYSLLYLSQALDDFKPSKPVQLHVITNNIYKVESKDTLHPEKATMLGICKVLPQENTQVNCRIIDVDFPNTDIRQLKDLLDAEIKGEVSDTVRAYRGRQCWVSVYEPVGTTGGKELTGIIKEKGTYLLTGGLSDIGMALASYLVEKCSIRLAVVEEEDLPDRERWDEYKSKNDNIGMKIRAIQFLESGGAEVFVVKARPDDDTQVEKAVDKVRKHFGPINGLIHTVTDTGVNTFKPIRDISYSDGICAYESKIKALYALEKVLKPEELDFCLLVSSLASVLGGIGQSVYAAANIFMDTFAECRSILPWLAINWDAWQFEVEQQQLAALTPSLAKYAISPAEGCEAFERIVSSFQGARIIVSTGDLQSRISKWIDDTNAEEEETQNQQNLHPRPSLMTQYLPPRSDLEKVLTDVWQLAIGIEKVGIDDNFFELGGDSLIAVKAINMLEQKLNTKIPAANLYRTPTIRALAELLSVDEEKVEMEVAAMLDERKAVLGRRNQLMHQRRKNGDG